MLATGKSYCTALGALSLCIFVAAAQTARGDLPDPTPRTSLETVYYDYIDEAGNLAGGRITLPVIFSDIARTRPAGYENGSRRSADNRIDFVIVGDGYTAEELDIYAVHADNAVAGFFAEEPFVTYSNYFLVHRIDVISNESGVDNDPVPGIERDTALDMGFWCHGIQRLLCVNVEAAYTYASNAPDVDLVLALANSTMYGGAGYPNWNLATASGGNGSAVELALHEIGHGLGNLADEYDYGNGETYDGPEPVERNVSILDREAMLASGTKWAAWMDTTWPEFDGRVSTYEGAYYHQYGIYRPTWNSKMRSLGRPFNIPSVEGLIIEFYKIVNPIDAATQPDVMLNGTETVYVDPLDPIGHSLDVQWALDGTPIPGATAETLDLCTLELAGGEHVLSVVVTDNTIWVRDEAARTQWMTQTLDWTLSVSALTGDVDGNCRVDVADLAELLGNYGASGATRCDGDLDGSGDVDLVDLAMLLALYGTTCP
ncbi:MAG: M64 family metallopeptidase [Phycisphaerae bacterium]